MRKEEFAQKVIMLRGSLGLTQEEFATKIRVSKRSVSAWENGDVVPKKTVRISMAVICNLPANEFLLDAEKLQNTDVDTTSQFDESELLNQLKSTIENSNLHDRTKDRYIDALYQTFNTKESN